ncbi:PorP/SprF family type IX secretion system membrane protein [Hymenobacter elongatus]|uniref:Type IX secretion system membrane protein PorP/SprF n=1 Tax=Hymenobacter elongatus TaxID=877208 RepID=A0A4Z0PPM4_9BACT|nr:type IX secretion system membrane protein PorP/SprF [Hymenobacter elongatus]TGE19630.1 type IX secretion system membrane protein PorP/SprF [Hymenobacter elongatus]
MKRAILSILLTVGLFAPVLAQQQPQFSHYGFNGMYLNPAYAGIKAQGEITSLGRYQYLGYSGTFDAGGSPQTYALSASIPVAAIGGGVGLSVFRDKIAESSITNVQISYSKHIKVGDGKLGIGVQGILNHLGKGEYRPADERPDNSVPRNGTDQKLDAGVGVWYESDKLYAGLSANNLLRSEYRFKSVGGENSAKVIGENHAYFTAGYNVDATSSVVVTPTVLVKMVLPGKFGDNDKFSFKNNSYEGGVRATINDKFWGGVAYRYDESITGLLGMSFAKDNALRFGYAFDLIAFNQDARAFSSHEIMLSYRLPKPGMATRPAVRTPRYSF